MDQDKAVTLQMIAIVNVWVTTDGYESSPAVIVIVIGAGVASVGIFDWRVSTPEARVKKE